jgi:tetratricopeptide (TPR) repeat protein
MASSSDAPRICHAQQDRVRLHGGPQVVVNPFIEPDRNSPAAPSAARGKNESTTAAGLRQENVDAPRVPPNPFAAGNAAPASRSLRWGPISRWTSPSIDDGANEQAEVPLPTAAPRLVAEPPILWPTPSDSRDLAGLFDDDGEDDSPDFDPMVVPARWSNGEPQQPTSLLPSGELILIAPANSSNRRLPPADELDRPALAGEEMQNLEKEVEVVVQDNDSHPGIDSALDSLGTNGGGEDPFEEPPGDAVFIADFDAEVALPHSDSSQQLTISAAGPTGGEVVPAVSLADRLVKARKMAERARTLDELQEVAQTCREILASPAAGGGERPEHRSVRQLAAWASNRRGELLADQRAEPQALAEFEAALEVDPDCWLALHNRAVSLAQAQVHEQALRDFSRVIELNPGLIIAYRNRGELLASLGRMKEAVEDYTRAIEHQPEEASLYLVRAMAYHRLRQYRRAMEDYNAALRLGDDVAEAYTGRGNLFAEIGRFAEAVRDFQQALTADDSFGEAYRSMSWLMATCPDPRFRDAERAQVAARRAADLIGPDDPFVLEAWAAALAAAHRFPEAAEMQSRAVAAAPPGRLADFEDRLALYRSRRPFLSESRSDVRPAVHQRPLR